MSKNRILILVGLFFGGWIIYELLKSPVTSKEEKDEPIEVEKPKVNIVSEQPVETGYFILFGKKYPLDKLQQ